MLVCLLGLACDKATPVAPAESTLTLSVSPSQITSASGTATVTALVLRKNGTPVNPGTEVRFSTTLGDIDEVARTDESGVARATLRGNGRTGTAKVRAITGGIAAVETDVTIGTSATSVTLQASPSGVPAEGGTVQLLALVRDNQGQPVQGATVNFRTEVGRLDSGGGLLSSNERGEVRDTLRVTERDLETVTAPTFLVTVQAGGASGGSGGGGGLVEETFEVRVLSGAPIADFSATSGGQNRVAFRNNSSGANLEFTWDFTNDGTVDSTARNPTYDYGTPGNFTVRLTAINSETDESDDVVKTITVPITQ